MDQLGHSPGRLTVIEIYRMDAEGNRWRIYDVSYHDRRNMVYRPGVPQARTRIFVPPEGAKRIHTFAKGESRALTDEHLERQLRSAGYVAREKFDPSEHRAR
jgi:hypothetical protein